MKKFVIDVNKNSKLKDFVLQNFPQISYNIFQKMLRKKDILVNRERVAKDVFLKKGDFLELYCSESSVKYFSVIYEDQNIIVVNKYFGIIVSTKDKTLPHELSLQELVEKEIRQKIFPLHRIDMNTSGLVAFCKKQKVFSEMKEIMKNHEVQKVYYAEVVGDYALLSGEHVAYLEKNSKTKSVFVEKNKFSERAMQIKTYAELLEKRQETSVVKVIISNGKTHQIRAHMAFLGHALVGDNKYGKKIINKKFGTRKQKLLAQKIIFQTQNPKYKYLNNQNIEIPQEEVRKFFNK